MTTRASACVRTERTVQSIAADLKQEGYLTRVREGRRNHYRITNGATFRHPAEAGRDIAGPARPLRRGPARLGPRAPCPPRAATRLTDGRGERTR
ncbi:hypothetical protein [Streptomyces sp. H27-S2]|uniref:hypothetical protein n=1 Tax=Streptomyces antarcticus TaxID=2996458 RepID=UPI00226FC6E8|nr:hypothetical protein [Streptomyces sp. H27-S2]MCY0951432.1 hypothetical protein [Streptomyces sp. H27-S2]